MDKNDFVFADYCISDMNASTCGQFFIHNLFFNTEKTPTYIHFSFFSHHHIIVIEIFHVFVYLFVIVRQCERMPVVTRGQFSKADEVRESLALLQD